MYQSKKAEPGGYVVYASGAEDAIERLSLTTRLRRAVEQQHWVLHWQPVVDLAEGTVSGVEALIRWREPNGGLVPPGEFIPHRGGARADRGDRRLGDRRGRPPAEGLGGGGDRPPCRLQPVATSALVGSPDGEGDGEALERRRRSSRRRRRDHRVDGDGRPRSDPTGPLGAPRVGAHVGDRRLRDRLLVARAPEAPARSTS